MKLKPKYVLGAVEAVTMVGIALWLGDWQTVIVAFVAGMVATAVFVDYTDQ